MTITIKNKWLDFIIYYFLCLPLSIHAHNTFDKKINTLHFCIKFPHKLTPVAQYMANTLETIYLPILGPLAYNNQLIHCLLSHKSMVSYSFFNSLTKCINIFSLYNPNPYFTGNNDFLTFTIIHEFRHAAQMLMQEHNMPCWLKPLYKVFNLQPLITVPNFFSEGDAVGIETAFTKSGRGRIPYWSMGYKVDILERGINKFNKQVHGSYRCPIPDYYRLGYYFTTFIQKNYGLEAINQINLLSSKLPILGFYSAVKKVTKKSVFNIYKDMSKSLLLMWQKQVENLKITPSRSLTLKKSTDNIDYKDPFIDSSNNIFAWKSGIGTRHQLIQLSPNTSMHNNTTNSQKYTHLKEKRLTFTLNHNSTPNQYLTIGQGCAVWLETYQDRYEEAETEIDSAPLNFIRLQHYDFKTKKTTNLIQKCRYNAVALSPSTKQLIVVESDKNCKQHLVILDTKSGTVIKRINNLDYSSYLTPNWIDEANIVVIQVKNQQNYVLRININTENVETLLPASYEHRNTPKIYKDYLLYNSSYNGIDNIYAMHLPTKACFQITSRKYGAYLGVVDPKTNQLFFCDYTKNGMDIAVMPFDPSIWVPLEQVEDRSLHYYTPSLKTSSSDILSKIPSHVYPITTNHFIRNNINWKPSYIEIYHAKSRNPSARLTLFELYNLQNSILLRPYIVYKNKIIQKHKAKKIRLGINFKYHTTHSIIDITSQATRKFQSPLSWYGKHTINLILPYYFTLNSSVGFFTWQTSFSFIPIKQKIHQTLGLKWVNQSLKSIRDIYPPWKQYFEYQVKRTTHDYNLASTKKTVNIDLFFPGIGSHHAFNIQTLLSIVHNKHTITYMAPEYTAQQSKLINTLWFNTNHKFTTNLRYSLPLFYPDLDIFNIGLLKAINMQSYLTLKWERLPNYTNTYPKIDTGLQFHFIILLLPFTSCNITFTYILILHYIKEKNKPWQFILHPNIDLCL